MLYSFLDAFSGYHQILMVEEDQEKTSFMADSAIYCYRVMPFGLKNAGVTYQRLVNKIFTKLIGKTVEMYVDDMVVKSKQLNSHVSDPEEVFATLRRYNMKLNSTKCAFGVASGKFLGFMITHRGIENAVSGVLVKEKGRVQQPIYYVSKVLLDAETRYTLAEQLALTLVMAVRKLRPYFQLHPIVVLTNQLLRHILQKPDVSGRLLKWAIELGEFDIEFKPRPAIKAQALADFIAELTLRSSETPVGNPNSTSGIWEIFVDRASNSSGSGAGAIITSPNKITEIQCALRFEFQATNNEAEYEAVIIALELAKNLECEHVKVFSDSQLVVAIAQNAKADALSKLVFMGVDGLDRTMHIKMVAESSIAQKPSIMDIDHEPSWMDPIVDYISNGNIPTDPRLARSIRPSESLQAMTEIHEGICGNHQGSRALAHKLIRLRPEVRQVPKFGNIIHTPIEELTSIHYSAPFEQWGVDILGPFPLARGQLKFVAVAVEYFTKWVEAKPLATVSEPKLRSFIWKSIICRFGIPKVLITDNGRQFDNPQFKNFYASNGIDHRVTSVSHLQNNGLAEVTNRIILQDLRTRIGDTKGDWPDMLPSILWAYRTSHKTATGETPFMLAFGLEAIIPIEVNLPTLRKLETNKEMQTT
ncbi:uncharacterized protein LOC111381405 [Olea europaea var. sylvestris]|uniref:uncharacterized protein LOC111381405 n=1 Tax=Olea europaea var. sylvestris TaxID=158386 RepID=UPI000C1D6B64|nr:uncharacterized protein LOC111381405 [Olea europaea var. sylvestris]